ncbi:unnamed protein product, partial [Mesorhabditis belari]|uniref:Uncharacterized protein n=1 Tax=Mesorhabditis belari TaxID=2138241 RepID=A0AAF3F8J9_9BILA
MGERPSDPTRKPRILMIPLGIFYGPKESCLLFSESITCRSETLYSTFAGGEPGYALNEEHHLATEQAGTFKAYITSTAGTIFTKSECSFCLMYETRILANVFLEEHLDINEYSIWTPPFYPWIHDLPEKINNQDVRYPFEEDGVFQVDYKHLAYLRKFRPPFTLEVKRAHPAVSVTAYLATDCYNGIMTFGPINVTSGSVYKFEMLCIFVEFPPTFPADKSTGFLMILREESRIFTLDPATPSFAIHGARLAEFNKVYIRTEELVTFLVTYTQYGGGKPVENTNSCLSEFPFLINQDTQKFLSAVEIPFTSVISGGQEWSHFITTQFKNEALAQLEFRDFPCQEANVSDYAIGVRVEKWVHDTKDFLLIPGIKNEPKQPYEFYILVKESTIATIVPHPEDYKTTISSLSPFVTLRIFGVDASESCSMIRANEFYKENNYMLVDRLSVWTPAYHPWLLDEQDKMNYMRTESGFSIEGEPANSVKI